MRTYAESRSRGGVEIVALPAGIRAEKDVGVEMRDGVTLRANVYRPEDGERFPVVMAFTMYDKDADPAEYGVEYATLRESLGLGFGSFQVSRCTPFEAPDPAYWVPHRYAVVHVDIRGTGKSEGRSDPFGSDTIADYTELIEWAGTESWSNGKVGLHGVSFLAIAQWFAAAENPPHLAAIVPWEGVSDPYRDVLYHGGVPETAFSHWWLSGMDGVPGSDEPPKLSTEHRTPPISEIPLALPRLAEIGVPALICASWSDQGLHTRGSVHAYLQVSSQHKWLYTHGRGKWSVYHSLEAMDYQRKFFDYFLKGVDSGMSDEARVRLEVRKTLDSWEVRGESEWPLARTHYQPAFLSPDDGSLGFDPLAKIASVSYDATGDEGARFDLCFTEDTEITGHMKLKLWVSTDEGDDMDLLVGVRKLDGTGHEVHFEGRENDLRGIVALGWIRASHRELDPELSTPWRPFLSHQRELRLEPGAIVSVEIEVLPSSTFFAAGETLRLEIKGRDVYANRMHQHKELCNCGWHTIHAGGKYDSHLLLPVIPRDRDS